MSSDAERTRDMTDDEVLADLKAQREARKAPDPHAGMEPAGRTLGFIFAVVASIAVLVLAARTILLIFGR